MWLDWLGTGQTRYGVLVLNEMLTHAVFLFCFLVLCDIGASVLFTDLEEGLSVIRDSIATNNLQKNCQVLPLSWGTEVKMKPFDLIVATDTMYLPDLALPLLKTIKDLSNMETVVYLAFGRNSSAKDIFFEEAQQKHKFFIRKVLFFKLCSSTDLLIASL
jgi:hypothetical protein